MKVCFLTFAPRRAVLAFAVVLFALSFSTLALWLASSQAVQAAPPAAAAPASDLFWRIEVVDDPKEFSGMRENSLRLDSQGRPHVAYGGDHLYYATQDGGGWKIETVDGANNVGTYASLALDAEQRPHIAYYDGIDEFGLDDREGGLKYASWSGSQWVIQTVDSGVLVGQWAFLVLDPEGRPHIAYQGAVEQESEFLKYAHWTGSQWEIQVVDSTPDSGTNASLAVESVAPYRAHIVYRSPLTLKYMRWSGSEWEARELPDGFETCLGAPIRLDGDDDPHLICTPDMKYAYWTGSEWISQNFDPYASGMHVSFAFGENGHPHIVYQALKNDALHIRHAFWNGAAWSTEIIAYTSSASISMALYQDRVRFTHHREVESAGNALEYGEWNGAAWQFEQVDSTGGVSGASSLAIDGSDHPRLAYTDGPNHQIKYAHWSGAAWEKEVVDDAVYSIGSLALDSTAPYTAHLAYTASGEAGVSMLKYARQTATGWDIQTLDSRVHNPALAVDSQGNPHISYGQRDDQLGLYLPRYLSWNGSAWVSQTITTGLSVNADGGDLALDRNDRPHLVFSTSATGLHYAHWTGEAWEITPLDFPKYCYHASLALDRSDRPHVSCTYELAVYDIGYAAWDGAAWVYDKVGDMKFTLQTSDLAVGASGVPQVSFPCRYGDSAPWLYLCYAYQSGSDWPTVYVDTAQDSGFDSSIALDSAGLPYISYHNYMYNDLYFAWPERMKKIYLPIATKQP